ncbi:MAG: hypothetical protein RH942_14330 [Kiloniellaceae bacterium]
MKNRIREEENLATQQRPAPRNGAFARRTTAAAVQQETMTFLASNLPPGWTSQPLAPGGTDAPAADILVISPRGRCHFLFVRAPADRWWDGGPHSVPAEKITRSEDGLARQLRAAGHRARAIWCGRDLTRALKSWGCPLPRPLKRGHSVDGRGPRPPVCGPARPTLKLGAWRSPADA